MKFKILFTAAIVVGITMLSAFVFDSRISQNKTTYRWTGAWMPMRISAADGVTALDTKIGHFTHLDKKQSYLNAVSNIHKKFPTSQPWVTWTVSDLARAIPVGQNLSDAQHDQYLSAMDEHKVAVFLEVFPIKGDKANSAVDAVAEIDKWLRKLKHHTSIVGVGVELEYFGKATDSLAAVWDRRIKQHNPKYRMFLRHYSKDFMPPTYRGAGDLIFVCDASEASIADLNNGFANWANHFAPTACAFQIGYPADEDGMDGSNKTGWWRLKDPVRDWGSAILPLIKDEKQELGLIWVTAKSGKSYHKDWDLTK
ncbi:hypothetical protein [Pseudochryseolinea flava]|uniref:GH26 domain-containing protein n=1 Tax=Pseudochryseolinea flava TaxID=2059302 RepID=A0A364Y5L5_9BACT|nr:hypothetical protein [Pseudochryseolinea flava]RAW01651.1 hypothetical protein DQQ10_08330 [Pseudochryseolinea flava]